MDNSIDIFFLKIFINFTKSVGSFEYLLFSIYNKNKVVN